MLTPADTLLTPTFPRTRSPLLLRAKPYPPTPKLKIKPMPVQYAVTTEVLERLTQASTVRFSNWRLVASPTCTAFPLLPSKIKPCPTRPGPKVLLPTEVPWLVPTSSKVLSSHRHQLTTPGG